MEGGGATRCMLCLVADPGSLGVVCERYNSSVYGGVCDPGSLVVVIDITVLTGAQRSIR